MKLRYYLLNIGDPFFCKPITINLLWQKKKEKFTNEPIVCSVCMWGTIMGTMLFGLVRFRDILELDQSKLIHFGLVLFFASYMYKIKNTMFILNNNNLYVNKRILHQIYKIKKKRLHIINESSLHIVDEKYINLLCRDS